ARGIDGHRGLDLDHGVDDRLRATHRHGLRVDHGVADVEARRDGAERDPHRHVLGPDAVDGDGDALRLEVQDLDAAVDRHDVDVERDRLAGRVDAREVDGRLEAVTVDAQAEVGRRNVADPAHGAQVRQHDRADGRVDGVDLDS